MKYSRSVIFSAAILLGASCSTLAFSSQAVSTSKRSRAFSTPLASTTSEKAEKTTQINSSNDSSEKVPLTAEFQAARDTAVSSLLANLHTPSLEAPLVYFMDEYFASLNNSAASGSTNPDGSPVTAKQAMKEMMRTLQFGMKYGLGSNKFEFKNVRHNALRADPKDERYKDESFVDMLGSDFKEDFYAAGCDFFRPSIDFDNSLVLGKDNLKQALEQISKGENVIFFANHQSEADPQVVSCLFETAGPEYGDLASHITYVAGHKVTTDPLAVPFSMGRNLLCIHSKKHIDASAETKPAKQKQNMAAMNEMLQMLREGGVAIWVAPSGGRDRRDVSTGKIPIAPFDQKTVDMFRLMGKKSKTPTHFYPLSMVSYDLCPPPDFVEAGVGEQRNVRFTPVGIAVMDEVPNVGGAEKRHLFTEKAEEEAIKGYVELLKGMGMERYIP